jgi:hypothetical protein
MHNSLFISSFNKIIALLLTIAVFVCACKGLDYVYYQADDFGRIVWHGFYEQENIDNLYVGSSHVYCDINPYALDEINGENNFNLSVGNMRLNSMYYAIREADRLYDLKNVVVEMYYETLIGDMGMFHSGTTVPNAWDCADYMHFSWNKLAFMWNLSEKEQYMETLFPFTRFRAYLFDTEFVKNNITGKQTEEYKAYTYHIEDEAGVVEFSDKGYGYTSRVLDGTKRSIPVNTSLSEDVHITEDAEKYLRMIVEYCQKEDIRLTLIVSPMYELQLYSTGDYDSYRVQIAGIAEEYGVPFYDFNLAKEEYLDIQYPENFMDTGHLNATGAALFTGFLWQVMENDDEANAEIFYSSFQEKKQLEPDAVWGVCYYGSGDNQAMVVATNKDWKSEYSVTAYPQSGEKRVLLKNDSSNTFYVPADEHGILKIKVKQTDTGSAQKIELEY